MNAPEALEKIDSDSVCAKIQRIWSMPLRHGPTVSIMEKDIVLMDIPNMNTTVLERALAQMALQAAQGDIKSFEVLMKYAGLQPVMESRITVDQPVIIDDISNKAIAPVTIPILDAGSVVEDNEEVKEIPNIEFVEDWEDEEVEVNTKPAE